VCVCVCERVRVCVYVWVRVRGVRTMCEEEVEEDDITVDDMT